MPHIQFHTPHHTTVTPNPSSQTSHLKINNQQPRPRHANNSQKPRTFNSNLYLTAILYEILPLCRLFSINML